MFGINKRPFCVKGGEIIGNVPTIEELAVYIKDYILNEGYGLAWASDDVKGATRQAIYNMHQTVVGQLEYKGLWDASGGNYPSDPELGWYYVVNVAGETGGVWYNVGDWIIWNGTGWDRLAGKADVYPVGAQFNYFGTGVKGDLNIRDYEISVANGDDFDMKGWFVCNGYVGTPDMIDKFTLNFISSGVLGGSDDAVVVEHSHDRTNRGIGTGSVAGLMTDTVYSSNSLTVDIGGSSLEGVSGVGVNRPSFISSIPIIKMG